MPISPQLSPSASVAATSNPWPSSATLATSRLPWELNDTLTLVALACFLMLSKASWMIRYRLVSISGDNLGIGFFTLKVTWQLSSSLILFKYFSMAGTNPISSRIEGLRSSIRPLHSAIASPTNSSILSRSCWASWGFLARSFL